MKTWSFRIAVFLAVISVFFFVIPGQVHAEEIKDFRVTAQIAKDGYVGIMESIQYDFGSLQKHGIYREIPLIKTNKDGKKFILTLDSISVTDAQNKAYKYSTSRSNNIETIKIGDPNYTISGVHNYNISYRIGGGITYFSDHDEFYWNVTGDRWNVPIESASLTVTLPSVVNPSDINLACYTGVSGSTDKNCQTFTNGNQYSVRSTSALSPGEGLTAVVGFPKNIVDVLEPKEYVNFFDTPLGKIVQTIIIITVVILVLVWYVVAPVFIIFYWLRHGKDPKPSIGQAHVGFDIPKTKSLRVLSPGEVGTLIDDNADMRDITATIVDLARRGYYRIVEKAKNDFYFVKNNPPANDKLQPHEATLYHDFFAGRPEVRVKNTDFVSTCKVAKSQLYDAVLEDGFFEKNPQSARAIFMVIGSMAFATFNIPLALSAYIFGHYMPKKTIFGANQDAIAKALKTFLVSQDKQLEYQAKNQLFFEKMLPYAIVFGVEKIWARRFKDIDMKKPDWYEGYGNNTYNSVFIASAVNSSMHNYISAATPTTSSSGFSSGFSGGSSGGGGGGGGGGSW